MSLQKKLHLLLLASCMAIGCGAQEIKPSNDTGLRPLTPYFTGDGNVNLTNGNLNLQIPLISLPGRNGMNYTFSLVYDSKMWSPHPTYAASNEAHYTWTDDSLNGDGGWKFNVPGLRQPVWMTDSNGNHIGNGDYLVTLMDGAKHALGRTSYFNVSYSDWSKDAEDGSGLSIENPGSSSVIVREKSGTSYTFDLTSSQTKVKDTNGNYILFGPNSIIDTVGRTISISGISSGIQTIGYKDSNGTSQTITLSYTTKQILVGFDTSNPYHPVNPPFHYPQSTSTCGLSGQGIHICVIQPSNPRNKTVLSSVTLPDNTQYTFDYNNYGELSKVVYPTGGYVLYEYGAYQHQETYWQFYEGSCFSTDPCFALNIQADFREVNKKTVCSTSDCASPEITVYVPVLGGTSNASETVYEGVPSSDTVPPTHYSRRTSVGNYACDESDTNFSRYCTPKEGSRSIYDSDGSLLKTTSTGYNFYGNYPLLPTSIATSYNGGPSSTEQLQYDTQIVHVLQPLGADYNVQTLQDVSMPIDNVTTRAIYDYGQTTTPLRKEVNTYLKSSYTALHILDRVLETQIFDGSNNLVADTQYEYDTPADGITSSGATNHDSGGTSRGNVSAVKRWRNTDGAWLITKNRWLDDAGNVLRVEDPLGHQTQLFYDDDWKESSCLPTDGKAAKAYLTKVISAAGIKTQGKYDSCSGKVGEIRDANYDASLQSTLFTYDYFGRLTSAQYPLGGSVTFNYPSPNTVYRSQAIATGINLNHTIQMDGRGRITSTILTSDPQGSVTTDTGYDLLGRVSSASNPYRSGDPVYYTATTYDGLDRPKVVTKPDGSTVQSVYSQNTVIVTDEALKSRKTSSDALGRLTQVLEPDLTGALNWQTNYFYNALGDLLCVEQRGDAGSATGCSTPGYYGGAWRVRRFVYNSLSQLTTASNPESNTINYTYDNDGQLKTKTDANGTVTTFSYVNDRLASKFYNPGTGVATSSSVNYTYDSTAGGNFGLGHRTGMTDGSGSTSWSYDAKGRVNQIGHTINGYTKAIGYAYNFDDSVYTVTYPSGRVLTYAPGGAGKPLTVADAAVNYVAGTCQNSSICYTASGALSGAKFGANITLSNSYNARLQPLTLSASVGTNTIMSRTYDFVGNVTDNGEIGDNGNVYGITDNLDSLNLVSRPIGSMKFRYDKLNRITQFKTVGSDCSSLGGLKNSGNTYSLDAWGNLTNKGPVTGLSGCIAEQLNEAVGYDNRFTGSGRYDLAGNMTSYGSYIFDTENRLVKIAGDSTPRYIYDGEGNRVAKPTMIYWLGADGSILAESNATGYVVSEYVFFNGRRIARIDLP